MNEIVLAPKPQTGSCVCELFGRVVAAVEFKLWGLQFGSCVKGDKFCAAWRGRFTVDA